MESAIYKLMCICGNHVDFCRRDFEHLHRIFLHTYSDIDEAISKMVVVAEVMLEAKQRFHTTVNMYNNDTFITLICHNNDGDKLKVYEFYVEKV